MASMFSIDRIYSFVFGVIEVPTPAAHISGEKKMKVKRDSRINIFFLWFPPLDLPSSRRDKRSSEHDIMWQRDNGGPCPSLHEIIYYSIPYIISEVFAKGGTRTGTRCTLKHHELINIISTRHDVVWPC
jgi:hypothetical protein